jgi:hypothetical protein
MVSHKVAAAARLGNAQMIGDAAVRRADAASRRVLLQLSPAAPPRPIPRVSAGRGGRCNLTSADVRAKTLEDPRHTAPRPHGAVMVPDDLFVDDPLGLSGPSLNTALLRQLRTAPGDPVEDLNAAFPLVALLRAEYLAHGTDGATTLEDGTIGELQRTARAVLQRLGVPLDLPWRNFTSFKSHWLANDGYGSWHARREMVAELFDPVQEQLESLEDDAVTSGGLVTAVTSHDQLGWPRVDSEIEQIRRSFHRARSPLECREVGLACVALLEVLSEVCYDANRHLYGGEDEPPVSNTKQRLSRVIEHEIADQKLGKELGRLVKRAAELSQAVKHSSMRTRTEAGIAADTVFLVANMLRRLRPDATDH